MKSNEEKPRRFTFEDMQEQISRDYLVFCLEMMINGKERRSGVFSRIFEENISSDDTPLDRLMIKSILYVLQFGWDAEIEKRSRNEIQQTIGTHGLDALLETIPEDEAREFRSFLKQAKLIT
jgi:hypothetical protein